MKIVITGMPIAMPEKVAKWLADRLGLCFVTTSKDMSADDVIWLYEKTDDMVMLTKYACLFKDATRICLYDSLTAEPTFPKRFYDEYNDNIEFGKNVLDVPNLYDHKLYDITINRASMCENTVTSTIVNLLQKGLSGDFVSSHAVMPVDMLTAGETATPKKITTFPVVKHLGCLYLYADYNEALSYADTLDVIPVEYVNDRTPELKSIVEYNNWFQHLKSDTYQLKLQHAIALFCKDKGYTDADATLLQLAENGDPWNKLQGLHYL